MGINDYGGTGDALNSPPLGGPGGWAEAVAAVVDGDDTTVDARIAAAVAGIDLDPYLLPAEVLAGANVTVDRDTTPGSVIIASTATGGGGGTGSYVNVTDYGAVGDGSTDDHAAITSAKAVSESTGLPLYFPYTSESYGVSAPLVPSERRLWFGDHMPRYAWDASVKGGSIIRALPGFSGAAVIDNASGASHGMVFYRLGVFGNDPDGQTGPDGLDAGPTSGGERAWTLQDCQVMYTRTGLTGHWWACKVDNNHIARNGYGVAAHRGGDADAQLLDTIFSRNYIYFNAHHNVEMAGARECGMVTLANNRFERAGVQITGNATMDPNVNSDPTAAGVKITRATCITLSGNTTDANAGGGLVIEAASFGAANNINGSANVWKRDGTGDNATTMLPAVRVKDASYVQLFDTITYGDPDDGGAGRIAPQYGVEIDGAEWFKFHGSIQLESNSLIQSNGVRWLETNRANWMCSVSDPRQPVLGVPYGSAAPSNPGVGSTYFNTSADSLQTWDGGQWVAAGGGSGGVTDHGELSGLEDDDHTQYLTEARGDALYSLLGHNHDGDYDPAGTAASLSWDGTQAQYDALGTWDPAVTYYVAG